MSRKRRQAPPQCAKCHAPLTFARIGPHSIPLDPAPLARDDTTGSVASYVTSMGGRVGRWLAKDERPAAHEKRYAQHRCPKPPQPEPQPDLFSAAQGDQ